MAKDLLEDLVLKKYSADTSQIEYEQCCGKIFIVMWSRRRLVSACTSEHIDQGLCSPPEATVDLQLFLGLNPTQQMHRLISVFTDWRSWKTDPLVMWLIYDVDLKYN